MTQIEMQGLRLMYYRAVNGLTCGELAVRIGVSAGALRGWERGDYDIKGSIMPDICSVLGVTANDILMPDVFDPAKKMHAIVRTCERAHKDDVYLAVMTRALCELRVRRGLNRTQLAERAHISPSWVSRYEQNGYLVRPQVLLRIYGALDMHYDYRAEEWIA